MVKCQTILSGLEANTTMKNFSEMFPEQTKMTMISEQTKTEFCKKGLELLETLGVHKSCEQIIKSLIPNFFVRQLVRQLVSIVPGMPTMGMCETVLEQIKAAHHQIKAAPQLNSGTGTGSINIGNLLRSGIAGLGIRFH